MLCVRQIINQRYQLQQLLGERPARQTWLALDTTTNSSVVIKFLAFGGQMQWSDLKLFEREAQILRELDHPCIPQYRDYFRIEEDTLGSANLKNTNLTGVSHLTNSQIKKSCNWEKAIYKGNWDENNSTWIFDKAANQEYIQKLKQDKASDYRTPVNCSRWE